MNSGDWNKLERHLWCQFSALDGQAHGTLGVGEPYPISESCQRLGAAEARLRPHVDQACAAWIKGEPLDGFADDILFLLRQRFWFALRSVQTMLTRFQSPGGPCGVLMANGALTEAEVTQWLLVDCWATVGVAQWVDEIAHYVAGAERIMDHYSVSFVVQTTPG